MSLSTLSESSGRNLLPLPASLSVNGGVLPPGPSDLARLSVTGGQLPAWPRHVPLGLLAARSIDWGPWVRQPAWGSPHFWDDFSGYATSAALEAAWVEIPPTAAWHNQNPLTGLARDPTAYDISKGWDAGGTYLEGFFPDADELTTGDGLFAGWPSWRATDSPAVYWYDENTGLYCRSGAKGSLPGVDASYTGQRARPDGAYGSLGPSSYEGDVYVYGLANARMCLFSHGGRRARSFPAITPSNAHPVKWSWLMWDNMVAGAIQSGREYTELRRNGSFVIFAAGLHNTVNTGVFSVSKYQFRNVQFGGWIQLETPRSRGWHLWEVILRHDRLDVYIDGAADPAGANLPYNPGSFDTIHLGSLITSNTNVFYGQVAIVPGVAP